MQQRTNKINRSIIDMDVDPHEKAGEIQERISATFNGRLQEEIDLLFSKYSLQDKITSIDHLELDIGSLSAQYLEEEFTEKVIKALEEKLQAYRLTFSLKAEQEKKEDRAEELEYLKHFLLYGYLPWQVSHDINFQELVQQVMETQASALIVFLKNTGANRYVRRRIAWQFSEPAVVGIIQTISPGHAPVILAYVKELEKSQQEEKMVEAPAPDFKKALYEFVLHYLLAEKGVDFNARMFTRSVLKQMSAHYNVDYPTLLFHLGEALALYDKASTKGSLLEVIEQIYAEDISGIEVLSEFSQNRDNQPGQEMVNRVGWASLFGFLQKGYFPSPSFAWSREETFALYEQLLKRSPATFERFFKTQQDPAVVERLTRFFSPSLVQQITRIVVGREQNWAHTLGKNMVQLNVQHQLIPASEKEMMQVANQAVLLAVMSGTKNIDPEKVLLHVVTAFKARWSKSLREVSGTLATILPGTSGRSHEWLHKLESGQPSANEMGPATEPTAEEKLALVRYFLLKGKLPWWVNTGSSEKKLRQWFEESMTKTEGKEIMGFMGTHIHDADMRKNILSLAGNKALPLIFSGVTGTTNPIKDNEWVKIGQQLGQTRFELFREIYLLHAFLSKEKTYLFGAELNRVYQRYGIQQTVFRNEMLKLGKVFPGLFYSQFMTDIIVEEDETDLEKKKTAAREQEKLKKAIQKATEEKKKEKQRAAEKEKQEKTTDDLDVFEKEKTGREKLLKETGPDHGVNPVKPNVQAKEKTEKEQQLKETNLDKEDNSLNPEVQTVENEQLLKEAGADNKVNPTNQEVHAKEKTAGEEQEMDTDKGVNPVNPEIGAKEKTGEKKQQLEETGPDQAVNPEVQTKEKAEKKQQPVPKPLDKKTSPETAKNLPVEQKTALTNVETNKINNESSTETGFTPGREKIKLPAEAELYVNALNDFILKGEMPFYFNGTFAELLQALQPYRDYFNGNLLHVYALSSLKDAGKRQLFLEHFDGPDDFAAFLQLFFGRQYQFLKKFLADWRTVFSHPIIGPEQGLLELTVLEHTFLFLLKNGSRPFGSAVFMKYFIDLLPVELAVRRPFFQRVVEMAREQEIAIPAILPYLLIEIKEVKPAADKKQGSNEKPEEPLIPEGGIFVDNAGAVILWPFLIHYYQQLGMLNEERKFKDEKTAYRAVHLLQYLVTGQEEYPEYKLVLNKILCGIQQTKPIDQVSEITEEEKKLSESLLNAVIQQWEIIKNSSIETLRDYFLIRNGKITSKDEKTTLAVEQKSIDMLVAKIPWGMSMIKLPWMNEPLYVKWK